LVIAVFIWNMYLLRFNFSLLFIYLQYYSCENLEMAKFIRFTLIRFYFARFSSRIQTPPETAFSKNPFGSLVLHYKDSRSENRSLRLLSGPDERVIKMARFWIREFWFFLFLLEFSNSWNLQLILLSVSVRRFYHIWWN